MRILLCDITHTTGGVAAANMVPLGIAMIGSYLYAQFPKELSITLCKFPDKAIRYLQNNVYDIVAFSNYVWNLDLSYKLAEFAKKRNRKTVVIFGGPNYPTDAQRQSTFFRARPIIDFYIYKEAEEALKNLVQSLLNHGGNIEMTQKTNIVGCHFYKDGFHGGKAAPRIFDLDDIPSPYTSGMLDEFLDGRLVPLVQTNRGCPFTCTYCSEGGVYHSKTAFHSIDRVYADLSYIANKYKGPNSLFIADSNFGMYSRDVEVAHKIAEVQSSYDWPRYINVATGKNQKHRVIECAYIIGGALRLGAAVQTTDPFVLTNIKRENLSVKEIISVGQAASLTGANTYSEVILCLPGETKKSHFNTIKEVISAGLNFVRCYTLMLLPAAEIATAESRGEYEISSRYRILPRCFGEYKAKDETIKSAEIEEVCVATNAMSFDDYIECRRFHLTIDLFYNDGIFKELFAFSTIKKIDIFDILLEINNVVLKNPFLKQLYSNFSEETKKELFISREELFNNFIENSDGYYKGDIGANLVFKYKTIGFSDYLEEMHSVAFSTLLKMLNSSILSSMEIEYLDDLKIHSLAKKHNLFLINEKISRDLKFDMVEAEKRNFEVDPSTLLNEKGCKIIYYHTPEQQINIKKHLDMFGSNIIGKARIFANVKVVNMYRRCEYDI